MNKAELSSVVLEDTLTLYKSIEKSIEEVFWKVVGVKPDKIAIESKETFYSDYFYMEWEVLYNVTLDGESFKVGHRHSIVPEKAEPVVYQVITTKGWFRTKRKFMRIYRAADIRIS